jgi:SAM-dependent methyltransferase
MIPNEYFNNIYKKEDPWGLKNTFADRVRFIILQYILNQYGTFQKVLDIGTGEGDLFARLSGLGESVGLDVSNVAISRANAKFHNINFFCCDPLNASKTELQQIKNNIGIDCFDLVMCLETIYYASDRLKALQNIKSFGTTDSLFIFSVVTIGVNKHREYFTANGFREFLRLGGFRLIGDYGFVAKSNLFNRIIHKLFNKILPVNIHKFMSLSDNNCYQRIFVARIF